MKKYNVGIIGLGVTGSSLAYVLSKYTDIESIIAFEQYDKPGTVNSSPKHNSQTLHTGPIESNYSIQKVREVYPRAMKTLAFLEDLPKDERDEILFDVPNMLLGVGKSEVEIVQERYNNLKEFIPHLQLLCREEIFGLEPNLVIGRNTVEPIIALYNPEGKAVNFGKLSLSFISNAKNIAEERLTIEYNTKVHTVIDVTDGYIIETEQGEDFHCQVLVVCADAHSLTFAKKLGYGKNFSLIPIGCSMYYTKQMIRTKVYPVQKPKFPFAGFHADYDIHVPDITRYGPTARLIPILESGKWDTMGEYFRISGLTKLKTWKAFLSILGDRDRRNFLIKNTLYELPFIGMHLVTRSLRKLIPSLKRSDIHYAKGFGGMRLQRVDVDTGELLLGDGNIVGDGCIFNLTPSPGATICMYNALRDTKTVVEKFLPQFRFFEGSAEEELDYSVDTSIFQSYPA